MIAICRVKVEKFFREKFVYRIFIKALQAFLHGLEKNTTCKTLELKVDEKRVVFFLYYKICFYNLGK